MTQEQPATIPFCKSRPGKSQEQLRQLELDRRKHRWKMLKYWWLKPHKPYQPVFVIATCRSGSNLLLDYLRQFPETQMLPEVLYWGGHYGPVRRYNKPAKALLHIRQSLQTLKSPRRGCKLMLYQLDDCELTLNDIHAAFPTAKYVVLYRQSMGDQFISQERAYATEQWLLKDGQQAKEARIRIDPAALRKYCQEMRESYRKVLAHSWLQERAALLSYEELTADAETCLATHVSPLLGVPPLKPQTELRKQNAQRPEECILNYREVAALLASPLCHQQHAWPGQQTQLRRRAAA